MQTDTPQPGEREVSGSVRHLMAELYGRPETRDSLASVGNLLLLGDEIITLRHDVRTLTRELAEARVVYGGAQRCIATLDQLAAEARAEVERLREFAALLSFVEHEHLDLRCVDVPTGGDDSDVAWVVIEHHMAEPHEREVGRGHTPLAALRAALAPAQEGACGCRACLDAREQDVPGWQRTTARQMIVCPDCRNKRCPHAGSHHYVCTGSNAAGQVGVPLADAQKGKPRA